MTQSITLILAVLTVIAQVLAGLGLLVAIGYKTKMMSRPLPANLVLVSVYIIAMIATLGSLYFSDVAGYTPCKLCWYQRIVMYPQAVMYLLGIALNDVKIGLYGFALSVIGILMALYHYLLQIGVLTTTQCGVVGVSVSCSDRFVTTFGYITIPMMALSAFLLIAVIWLVYWSSLTTQKIK